MFIISEFCVPQIIINQIDWNFSLYKALLICKIVIFPITFTISIELKKKKKINLNIIKAAT